jgi:hypothetical protein
MNNHSTELQDIEKANAQAQANACASVGYFINLFLLRLSN